MHLLYRSQINYLLMLKSATENRKWGNLSTVFVLNHIALIRLCINTKFRGHILITSLANQFHRFEDWGQVSCSKNSC